jgi:CheY-like chemotaxis protein
VRENRDTEPGQFVCVAISDNGTGMPPEVAARVFEPFFTTKPAGAGSGLGLSMVYGFARQSGGHVKIYTEPDRGTTVRLYLPRAHGAAPIAKTRDLSRPPGGSESICLVEDDDLVRRFTESTLVELGYRVCAFANAEAAFAALSGGLDADLLLTDVVLPGTMNGPQLARAAQEIKPRLKVLFVSGYTQNAIVHHGRLDPGVELLSKPFRRADLAARLRRILD